MYLRFVIIFYIHMFSIIIPAPHEKSVWLVLNEKGTMIVKVQYVYIKNAHSHSKAFNNIKFTTLNCSF